jgi:WhiB family redox-sensing transcriptional regulator
MSDLTRALAVPDWTADALCAQTDPALFFPKKGGSTREAKAVCTSCPVRQECLDYALDYESHNHPGADTRAPHGIWGGLTERERRALLRDRRAADMPEAS